MTRAAYFECFAGASGDMILGALVDAGWPEAALRHTLAAVPVGGWAAEVRHVKKGALRAVQVRIRVTEPQPERGVEEIAPLIEASTLDPAVKSRATALFRELAAVEGLEHDQPPERVHFHEVGAVDSILDIVGACAGLHALGIERLYVSPINVGGGTVATRDGILPVPGPAALELLRRKRAPIYASHYGPEFLTPTGALVLATLADGFGPFPPLRVERIGYGAGQKDFAIPNVLRVSIGEVHHGLPHGLNSLGAPGALDALGAVGAVGSSSGAAPQAGPAGDSALGGQWPAATGHSPHPPLPPNHRHAVRQYRTTRPDERVVQLETNIDDMNPEWYGHLADLLQRQGALDVTMAPVFMKKGRPGTLLTVLVQPEHVEAALATLFVETTTLGVRIQELARRTLDRRIETVATPFGPVRVKLGLLDGAVRNAAPEYEDCRAAALRAGAPLQQVYAAAVRAAAPPHPAVSEREGREHGTAGAAGRAG